MRKPGDSCHLVVVVRPMLNGSLTDPVQYCFFDFAPDMAFMRVARVPRNAGEIAPERYSVHGASHSWPRTIYSNLCPCWNASNFEYSTQNTSPRRFQTKASGMESLLLFCTALHPLQSCETIARHNPCLWTPVTSSGLKERSFSHSSSTLGLSLPRWSADCCRSVANTAKSTSQKANTL